MERMPAETDASGQQSCAAELRHEERARACVHAREESHLAACAHGSGWYVIQVPTGKERALCELIVRTVGRDILSECFSPSYATQMKVRGEWKDVERLLFPGYVIAVASDVEELKRRLCRVTKFTRLLAMGKGFVPLSAQERAWISTHTTEGSRVIPMSMGVMEGDRVRVLSGPLKGHEAWIVSINRRKSVASIRLDMFGRQMETKIGLGVLKRESCLGSLETR